MEMMWCQNCGRYHESTTACRGKHADKCGGAVASTNILSPSDLVLDLARLRAERDELRGFADDVLKWSEAYPTNIFTEPTPEQIDAVCKTLGFSLDRIAAMVLREFTKPWGDRARAIISRMEGEEVGR